MEEDTQRFQTVELERPAPPPGRPPSPVNDVWPWLALLGILAVAGLLVWLFFFRGHQHTKHVVPAVVAKDEEPDEEPRHGEQREQPEPRPDVVDEGPGGRSRRRGRPHLFLPDRLVLRRVDSPELLGIFGIAHIHIMPAQDFMTRGIFYS